MKSTPIARSALLTGLEVTKTYPERSIIFKQGAKFEGVYYVVKGSVLISTESNNHKRFNLWRAVGGELIGLTSYFNNTSHYSFTAQVISESATVAFIPGEQFNKVLVENPTLRNELMKMLCVRISLIENQTLNMLTCSSKRRLASVLLSMAGKQPATSEDDSPVYLPYNKEELAIAAGVKPSYLEKLMAELREERILRRRHNKVIIGNLEALAEFCMEDSE